MIIYKQPFIVSAWEFTVFQVLTLFEVELWVILHNSHVKLFIQWDKSSESPSFWREKRGWWSLFLVIVRINNLNYFEQELAFSSLVIQFPAQENSSILRQTRLLLLQRKHECTRHTREKESLTTAGKSINGRVYGFGVNMNSWQMEWTLLEQQWLRSTAHWLEN